MVPGLSAVTKVAEILNGFPNTPASPASAKAFEEIASINDRQDEMFFTMAEEIASLKARITKLENK